MPQQIFESPHQQAILTPPNRNQSSTHRPTFEEVYAYFESITSDWTEAEDLMHDYWLDQYSEELETGLKRPNPPTPEMIERAQFKDKTFKWNKK